MGRGLLLWLLGIPLPIILLIWCLAAFTADFARPKTATSSECAEARREPASCCRSIASAGARLALHCGINPLPDGYLVRPDPLDPRLTKRFKGIDQTRAAIETAVVVKRGVDDLLDAQEIVTAMSRRSPDSGARLPAQPEHAVARTTSPASITKRSCPSSSCAPERKTNTKRSSRRSADFRLRPGRRIQRFDGGIGEQSPCRRRNCAPRRSIRSRRKSTPRRPSTSRPAPSTAAC